jgi:hypothetical protein
MAARRHASPAEAGPWGHNKEFTMSKSKPKATKHDEPTIGGPALEKARRIALAQLTGAPTPKPSPTLAPGAPAGAGAAVWAVEPVGSPVPPKAKGGKKSKVARANASKAKKEPKPKKLSGLDAAAMILAAEKRPMNMKEVFAETQSRKLWTTKGATPEATLYAAVIREIAAKGKDSRFKKHDRGLFTATAKG